MTKVSVSGESAYQPGWSSVLKMLSNSSIVGPTAPSFSGARKPEKCEHDSRRTEYITSMLTSGALPPAFGLSRERVLRCSRTRSTHPHGPVPAAREIGGEVRH